MGIPSYFSLIIRKYKNIVQPLCHIQTLDVKHFFLDCNSIVYDTYHGKEDNVVFTEEWLIEGVVQKIKSYVHMVRPSCTLYIAFDGVAPLAKMEQQRARRYKGVHFGTTSGTGSGNEKQSSANIPKQLTLKDEFHLSCITPGTLFMGKLMKEIDTEFSGKEQVFGVQKIVVSTSENAGEGEHKLFQYVRDEGMKKTDISVVYGLDADLIMLSIFHLDYMENIFVCREAPEFYKRDLSRNPDLASDDMLFLDIGYLRRCIFTHLVGDGKVGGIHQERVVHDYVFLCFLLGNDFLPHFPTLNIRTRGMDILLDTYRQHLLKAKKHLVDVAIGRVLWNHVHSLFRTWSEMEHEILVQEHHNRDKLEMRLSANKKDGQDTNNFPLLYRPEERYINPKEQGWEIRYYRALFGISESDTHNDSGRCPTSVVSFLPPSVNIPKGNPTTNDKNVAIKDICINYCEGLEWVFRYYTSNCPNWQWKYRYHYPPLFSDLVMYRPHHVSNHYQYLPSDCLYNPCSPIQQLEYVMPASQKHLIPGRQKEDVATSTHFVPKSPTELAAANTPSFKGICVFAYCRYLWETHIY